MATSLDIRIADGMVHVGERDLFGTKHWTLPLTDFRGISHDVRNGQLLTLSTHSC